MSLISDSPICNGPLLAIDLGAIQTRAMLFDVVGDHYDYLGCGIAPTTAVAPFHGIRRGMHLALEELQAVTGRVLLNSQKSLIRPVNRDSAGVEHCVATISAGPLLKILVVGLLTEISVQSALSLAACTYASELRTLALDDLRMPETVVDELLYFQPDLVLLSGGTERGAHQALLRLYEPVRMAFELLPDDLRPEILFAGNQTLLPALKKAFKNSERFSATTNLTPVIGHQHIENARRQLAAITGKIWRRKIPGYAELERWSNGVVFPTAHSFGRMISFLNQSHNSEKGVLGLELSYPSFTLAAAKGNELVLGVFPLLSQNNNGVTSSSSSSATDLNHWLSVPDISESQVQAMLLQQKLYPASLPLTPDDLALENAWLRSQVQQAFPLVLKQTSTFHHLIAAGSSPWFEPVLASGEWLRRSPGLAHTALMLIDSLQPGGVTTLVLDEKHILPALGAAAEVNPLLSVQLLDSQALIHLATLIVPVGSEPTGTPILRARIFYEDGREASVDVRQGSLEVVPLPSGQVANIHLQPFHRYDIGMGGAGRGGSLKVSGSALGVIIDGRGRPLKLPDDINRRQEMYTKWLWTLGG